MQLERNGAPEAAHEVEIVRVLRADRPLADQKVDHHQGHVKHELVPLAEVCQQLIKGPAQELRHFAIAVAGLEVLRQLQIEIELQADPQAFLRLDHQGDQAAGPGLGRQRLGDSGLLGAFLGDVLCQ
jgi:hypothetical protein